MRDMKVFYDENKCSLECGNEFLILLFIQRFITNQIVFINHFHDKVEILVKSLHGLPSFFVCKILSKIDGTIQNIWTKW